MKKIMVVLLLALFSISAFAQEFTVDGEIKTGIFWYKLEDQINPDREQTNFHSKDDAGSDGIATNRDPVPGRFRINMAYRMNNIGFKIRFQIHDWQMRSPDFAYAFGYGDFFEDQLTVSLGMLGASPWGTGGPEMWRELEEGSKGGIRTEYKPYFLPGLNVGFVLNWYNGGRDQTAKSRPDTFADILQETVLGVSYTHELFLVRFAYRLDSEMDRRPGGAAGAGKTDKEGDDLIYRLEEYILKNYLPGLSLWALGSFEGVGADESNKDSIYLRNWLFAEYAPEMFTAQIRFGFDYIENRSVLHVKPSFYWHFFDKLVSVGASFWYGQDFGEGKVYPNSPFYFIELEPKLQVNFSPNAYVAFAYNWRLEYVHETWQHTEMGIEPYRQLQWVNLRVGVFF